MKMYSREGTEMMDMMSLHREGDIVVVKGKMMGAMITSICLKPEDAWKSLGLLSWSVIWYFPIILVKGFWANWRQRKQRRGK